MAYPATRVTMVTIPIGAYLDKRSVIQRGINKDFWGPPHQEMQIKHQVKPKFIEPLMALCDQFPEAMFFLSGDDIAVCGDPKLFSEEDIKEITRIFEEADCP